MQRDQERTTRPEPLPVRPRFEALLFDHLLVLVLLFGISLVASFAVVDPTAPAGMVFLSGGLYIPLFLGYKMATEARDGQTPGKSARDIAVEMTDRSPCTARAAVVRNLVLLVEWLPTSYLIGLGIILARDDGRRLGDLAAGTTVVSTTD